MGGIAVWHGRGFAHRGRGWGDKEALGALCECCWKFEKVSVCTTLHLYTHIDTYRHS